MKCQVGPGYPPLVPMVISYACGTIISIIRDCCQVHWDFLIRTAISHDAFAPGLSGNQLTYIFTYVIFAKRVSRS